MRRSSVRLIPIDIFSLDSPITYAWSGGKFLSQSEDFKDLCMTRDQYDEEGLRGAAEKFDI